MFTVIAKIVAKSEASLRVKKSLEKVVEAARDENCCQKYILYEATDDPNLYMIYQNWQSEEAFDSHFNSELIKSWSEKNRDLIKSWKFYFLKEII